MVYEEVAENCCRIFAGLRNRHEAEPSSWEIPESAAIFAEGAYCKNAPSSGRMMQIMHKIVERINFITRSTSIFFS